jgi:hypothetical protein
MCKSLRSIAAAIITNNAAQVLFNISVLPPVGPIG